MRRDRERELNMREGRERRTGDTSSSWSDYAFINVFLLCYYIIFSKKNMKEAKGVMLEIIFLQRSLSSRLEVAL